jgi:hypothetical protein
MEVTMKKVLLAFVVVFVFFELYGYLVDGVLLASTYQSLQNIWRQDMDRLMWVFQVIMLVGAFFFVFVFSRGYEGKGIMEGVRYGLYIGIWMGMGFAYGTYAMIAIPYSLAVTWFVSTIIQYIIAGILAALVYGKTAMVTRVPSA